MMVDPTNAKPRRLRSLLSWSDSGVRVGSCFAVAGHDRGLLVSGCGAQVRKPGLEMPVRRRLMGIAGSLERLLGTPPGPRDGLFRGRHPTLEFIAALPQLVRPRARKLGA